MFLYSDAAIKAIDTNAITNYDITSLQLQESAAFLCFNFISKTISKNEKGVVVVGKGNNGADGLAIARMLYLAGFDISIYYFSSQEGTEEYNAQKKIVTKLGIHVVDTLSSFDYLIDALIGVGCKKDLSTDLINIINEINSLKTIRFSIDMPTGMGYESNSDVMVKAHYTLSLGVLKGAFYLKGNRVNCGQIELLTPLFPTNDNIKPIAKLVDLDALNLATFECNAYKKTRGDLIIVGSSKSYPSTVLLSSKAAFASGIGLVTIYTDDEVIPLLSSENPSLMVRPYSAFVENEKASLLLGPGLGYDNDEKLLPFLKLKNKKVIDADGIRAFSRLYQKGLIKKLENAIFTPHLGELKVLFETFLPQQQMITPKQYLEGLIKLSKILESTLVIKSEVAIVVNGEDVKIVDLVNPSMAVAGSGDVLASIIATLSINDDNPALNGVLLHKKAGMKAREKYGFYSALELVKMLGKVR